MAELRLKKKEAIYRGPLGTIFREDCGEDVEVRPTEASARTEALSH